MTLEVARRVRYILRCSECTASVGGSYMSESEAQKNLDRYAKYPCKTCRNREHVASLPAHHPHRERHKYQGTNGAFCCGANQLGVVGPNDCNECGEPWPCSIARLT